MYFLNIANILENQYIVDRMHCGDLYEMYHCPSQSTSNG